MSFNTFVRAEFMHRYSQTLKTYWQQYATLAGLVEYSWTNGQHAKTSLTTYLENIRVITEDEAWEQKAWENIWTYTSERTNILMTVGKLKKMLPEDPYVQLIHAYIFEGQKDDLLKLLDKNGMLLEFFPDDPDFQLAAIGNNTNAARFITQNGTIEEIRQRLLEKSVEIKRLKRLNGIYTNNGNKLSTIGDLHGDFEATIRVLQNMEIISVKPTKHQRNLDIMEYNMITQVEKNEQGEEPPKKYRVLDYTAYEWIYDNNMLVQTGDLFDRRFNSREIIELFIHLATTSGDGQVINMAGNHEFMQYQYGLSEMDYKYKHYQIEYDSMSYGETNRWDSNRNRNLQPGSKYFEWIKQLPVVVYETKSKTIFSHGCIVEKWTNISEINRSVRQIWEEMVSDYNKTGDLETSIQTHVHSEDSPINCLVNGRDTEALSEIDGPIWNRYYNNAVKNEKPEELRNQLQKTVDSFAEYNLPVDRLVCAHTITNMERIQRNETKDNDCEFKPEQHPVGQTPSVWFIDIGMTEGYGDGKRWGGLELTTADNGTTQVVAKHPTC